MKKWAQILLIAIMFDQYTGENYEHMGMHRPAIMGKIIGIVRNNNYDRVNDVVITVNNKNVYECYLGNGGKEMTTLKSTLPY